MMFKTLIALAALIGAPAGPDPQAIKQVAPAPGPR